VVRIDIITSPTFANIAFVSFSNEVNGKYRSRFVENEGKK
jgi:hypothetical protein